MQKFKSIYVNDTNGKWAIFDNESNLGITSAIYTQNAAASIWTLQHNLNKEPFLIETYKKINNIRTDIKAAKITFTLNTITIFFNTPTTGFVDMVFANDVII